MADKVSMFVSDSVGVLRDDSAFVRQYVVRDVSGWSDADIVFVLAQFNVIQAYVSDVQAVLRVEILRREQLAPVGLKV